MTLCYNQFKKIREKELLFSNNNILKNLIYKKSILSVKKNLKIKYLEFFSKEHIYIIIQKVFQKEVFSTLKYNSFFSKSNHIRTFSKVFFFFFLGFFFFPQKIVCFWAQ